MTDPTIPEQLKWPKDDYSNIIEPFADDHWGRKQFAEHLTGYVGRMKVGATIAIDAEWGAGKTWFVQHWRQHLIKKGHDVAYIDAFANDYIDDPFLLIATEIASQVEKKQGKRLRKTAVSVYHAMLPSLPKLIFSAAMTLMSAGLVAQSITETVEGIKEATGDFGEKFSEDMSERIRAQLEEKVQNHEADKKTLESFKQQLIEIASKLDKPLVFIIDELDRCKPEFSIRLIERIKHFFEIPNIVFVLAIHKKQLCESIDSYYGFKSENQYLEKFIDFSFKLSAENSFEDNSRSQIIALIQNLGLTQKKASESRLFFMCKFLSKIYRPTPRQLKSIINKLVVSKSDVFHIFV
ncbi:MAG: P-loop NTPase fold protein [Moraxellaceae bacterium]